MWLFILTGKKPKKISVCGDDIVYQLGKFFKIVGLMVCLLLLPFILSSPHHLKANNLLDTAENTKVIVLNYHMVEDKDIALSVLPKDFDAQMAYLKEHDFHPISTQELYRALTEGIELPKNPVLITFDDGYLDNYTVAYPILKKYGFKAAFFIVTGFLDDKNPLYMSWEQLKEMAKDGMDFESHTVSHKSLTDVSEDVARYEIQKSKERLEEELGKKVLFLAYPTGTYNLHIAQMLRDAGYKGAFTIKYGNVDMASNLFALERVPVFHTENTFKSFLDRLRYLPIFERLGWMKM